MLKELYLLQLSKQTENRKKSLRSHINKKKEIWMHQKTIIEQPLSQNDLNADTKEFPCTPGTMYIFPSDFVHGVTRQMVDDRKIVISFNVCKRDGPEFR